jgi:predicted nucleic acid-binding protein
MIVVDASAALAWILPRQATSSAGATRVGRKLRGARVFHVELRNVLLKAERRGLIADAEADQALADFRALVRISGAVDLDGVYRLARAQPASLFTICDDHRAAGLQARILFCGVREMRA